MQERLAALGGPPFPPFGGPSEEVDLSSERARLGALWLLYRFLDGDDPGPVPVPLEVVNCWHNIWDDPDPAWCATFAPWTARRRGRGVIMDGVGSPNWHANDLREALDEAAAALLDAPREEPAAPRRAGYLCGRCRQPCAIDLVGEWPRPHSRCCGVPAESARAAAPPRTARPLLPTADAFNNLATAPLTAEGLDRALEALRSTAAEDPPPAPAPPAQGLPLIRVGAAGRPTPDEARQLLAYLTGADVTRNVVQVTEMGGADLPRGLERIVFSVVCLRSAPIFERTARPSSIAHGELVRRHYEFLDPTNPLAGVRMDLEFHVPLAEIIMSAATPAFMMRAPASAGLTAEALDAVERRVETDLSRLIIGPQPLPAQGQLATAPDLTTVVAERARDILLGRGAARHAGAAATQAEQAARAAAPMPAALEPAGRMALLELDPETPEQVEARRAYLVAEAERLAARRVLPPKRPAPARELAPPPERFTLLEPREDPLPAPPPHPPRPPRAPAALLRIEEPAPAPPAPPELRAPIPVLDATVGFDVLGFMAHPGRN